MKRHHNTSGFRQIQNGKTMRQVSCMAKRLERSKCKCGSGLTTERHRRLTQYADDSKNYITCCSLCIEQDNEFYKQMWKDYYSDIREGIYET